MSKPIELAQALLIDLTDRINELHYRAAVHDPERDIHTS